MGKVALGSLLDTQVYRYSARPSARHDSTPDAHELWARPRRLNYGAGLFI